MSNELEVKNQSEMALWDSEKWKRVMDLFVPKKVSQMDAQIFLELSKSFQLNPFKKEIWVIPYENKQTGEIKTSVFCGRDGFLSIAHRTGQFDGIETNFGYDAKGNLDWAECAVYNKSCSKPIKCKVFLKEYSTGKNLWVTKPHIMLQKVAESTALRRAFNINGIYSPEEFPDSIGSIPPTQEPKEVVQPAVEPPKRKSEDSLSGAPQQPLPPAPPADTTPQKTLFGTKIEKEDAEGRAAVKDAGFKWNFEKCLWCKLMTEDEYVKLSQKFDLQALD